MLSLVLAACGPSIAARSSGEVVDLHPRLAVGSVYEVLHRETQLLEGSEPKVLRTRTLGGRVVARFRIEVDGTVRGGTIPENTTGSPAVVGRVVEELRFRPGPVGGGVTYSFPFVFAVQP